MIFKNIYQKKKSVKVFARIRVCLTSKKKKEKKEKKKSNFLCLEISEHVPDKFLALQFQSDDQ